MGWEVELFRDLRVPTMEETLVAEKKLLLFARWLSRDYVSGTVASYVGAVRKAHRVWLGVPLESLQVAFYRLPMLMRVLRKESPSKVEPKTPWPVENFERVLQGLPEAARMGVFADIHSKSQVVGGGRRKKAAAVKVSAFEQATSYAMMCVAFAHLLRMSELAPEEGQNAAKKKR